MVLEVVVVKVVAMTDSDDCEQSLPILDLQINTDCPIFGELYLDLFPEWYDVE
jgi:hypothetical protein